MISLLIVFLAIGAIFVLSALEENRIIRMEDRLDRLERARKDGQQHGGLSSGGPPCMTPE